MHPIDTMTDAAPADAVSAAYDPFRSALKKCDIQNQCSGRAHAAIFFRNLIANGAKRNRPSGSAPAAEKSFRNGAVAALEALLPHIDAYIAEQGQLSKDAHESFDAFMVQSAQNFENLKTSFPL